MWEDHTLTYRISGIAWRIVFYFAACELHTKILINLKSVILLINPKSVILASLRKLEEQPEWLKGGKLRDYQLEGLNFLVNRYTFSNFWCMFSL